MVKDEDLSEKNSLHIIYKQVITKKLLPVVSHKKRFKKYSRQTDIRPTKKFKLSLKLSLLS